MIPNETRPPFQDRTREFRVGIGEETQGVAMVECEYSNMIVGAPIQQPDVTIPHKMGLGTAGLQQGVATECSANTNIVLATPTQQLDVTIFHELEVDTAELSQGVATQERATRTPQPTISVDEGDIVPRVSLKTGLATKLSHKLRP